MAERPSDLFALVDGADRVIQPASRFGWVVNAMPALVLVAALALAVWLPPGIPLQARAALFAFGTAAILWTLTSLESAYVALGSALFLVLSRAIDQSALLGALKSDVVWLMIGTFVVGRAFEATGLSARLSGLIGHGRTTVGGMTWRLAFGLIPLTFVIPSTSGRAAVLQPLFRTLVAAVGDRRITRALALLIPSVLLVSTISSLVGAGSHLIANDILERLTGERIGFARWVLWGLPFGLCASVATAFVVSRTFLNAGERARPIQLPQTRRRPLSSAEWRAAAITGGMVGLWATEGLHPLGIAVVAVLGGFLLTTPGVGVISWKDGLKAVSWNLVLFMGTALVLGEALISTGAASWLIGRMIDASGLKEGGSDLVALLGLAFVSLTSHLYFASHSARAAALLPPLLYLASSIGLKPVAVMFITTVGANYCLTFPFSSKALLLFQESGGEPTCSASDLLMLSAVMIPVHALMIVGFYYLYWSHVGLSL